MVITNSHVGTMTGGRPFVVGVLSDLAKQSRVLEDTHLPRFFLVHPVFNACPGAMFLLVSFGFPCILYTINRPKLVNFIGFFYYSADTRLVI